MLSPEVVYPLVLAWLEAFGAMPHAASRRAVADRLTALFVAQSLAPAALMRALLSPQLLPARQRYQRVARIWRNPGLRPAWLTGFLVRAALCLVAPVGVPVLAMDSVRCGPWEIFTVGLVWHRRVVIVGWRLLPYPWPRGQFTPTVCAMLREVAAAWPKERPMPHLVADRGFPSQLLFATLTKRQWSYSIRLRATDVVWVDGVRYRVRELLERSNRDEWTIRAATYGTGKQATAGQLVLGRGLDILAWHQRDNGSARARAHRAARRLHNLHSKHPRQRPDQSAKTDPWVVLFTTETSYRPAVCAYRLRWSVEGSYRDAQSGWDGRHGWDLEPTVTKQTDPDVVSGLVGLWALGLLIQSWVGDQVGRPDAPETVQAVVRGWTTTGRLSVWGRGRLAFTERSGSLADWLQTTLAASTARLTAAPPPPTAPPETALPQAA